MTATRTLYRSANVSSAEAISRLPANTELVSFETKEATADEARAAKVNVGDQIFAATIRVAEFPPSEEKDDSGSEEGGEDAGAPAPKKDSDGDFDGDSDSDSDSDDGGDKPPFGGGEDHGHEHGAEPKKLSPEEQVVHLLQQILDKLSGPGDDLGPGGPGAGLDLPDVGAPDKGDLAGPPAPGGPGLGGPGKAPLPPPVKEKSPIGAGAFAAVAKTAEAQMVRQDANEVNNATILAEAAEYAPSHRVAQIKRTGLAQIGNDVIDLAEARLALVTLVSK